MQRLVLLDIAGSDPQNSRRPRQRFAHRPIDRPIRVECLAACSRAAPTSLAHCLDDRLSFRSAAPVRVTALDAAASGAQQTMIQIVTWR